MSPVPTTPTKRLAIMPPPARPLTPRSPRTPSRPVSSHKLGSLVPSPKTLVTATVHTVTRVKSEMPSPPPTPRPTRVKTEPVDIQTPDRTKAVVPHTPSRRSVTPSSLIRRQSSAAPTTRARSAFKFSPAKRAQSAAPKVGWGQSRANPVEIEYSPPPSPTPSYRRASSQASSTRSEELVRGGSPFATLHDPFVQPRQRIIRRPKQRDEDGPTLPIVPLVSIPADMMSALIQIKALIADLVGSGERQEITVASLLVIMFGEAGGTRNDVVDDVVEALAPIRVDRHTILDLITILNDATRRSIEAHIRRYKYKDGTARRESILCSEWYKRWRTYINLAGENVAASIDCQTAEKVQRALEEVWAMNAKTHFDQARTAIPAIDKDQLRQWRDLVRRIGAAILKEIMG